MAKKVLFGLSDVPDFDPWDAALVEFDDVLCARLFELRKIISGVRNGSSINVDDIIPVFDTGDIPFGVVDKDTQAHWADGLADNGWVEIWPDFDIPDSAEQARLGLGELVACPDRFYWELWPKHEGRRFETKGMTYDELKALMGAAD